MYNDLLRRLSTLRAVVVGDVMCDEYIAGHAMRVSPEAPVMVIRHESHRVVPGGAANVARNLCALGLSTACVGVIGNDAAGELLRKHTPDERLQEDWITEPGRITTRKTRVLADRSQQVVRIDHEDDSPIRQNTADQMLDRVQALLNGAGLLLLSDYRKGVLGAEEVRRLVEAGHAAGAYVAANAKPESLPSYRGADLVSVNRAEASRFLGHPVGDDVAHESAEAIRNQIGARSVLITLGEAGMVLAAREGIVTAMALHDVVRALGPTIVPFTERDWFEAVREYHRRRSAGGAPRFGECLSAVVAARTGSPLVGSRAAHES